MPKITAPLPVKELPLGEDWAVLAYVTGPSPVQPGPLTGLANLYGWLSLTRGGAEVHASCKVALAEVDAVTLPGWYKGTIAGSATAAQLAAHDGQTVYEMIGTTPADAVFTALVVRAQTPAG
jgi:hypothetical protein